MQPNRLPAAAQAQQGFMLQPPAGVLGWLPPQFWRTDKEFYGYNANFLPIAAGQTSTVTVSIQADTDFIMLAAAMQATATDNVTPLAFAPALVELKDASSGTTLTQSPVHVESLFGDARQPGVFAIPYFLRANSALQVTLQNLDAANARNYRFTFYGFRSWPGSDYTQSGGRR